MHKEGAMQSEALPSARRALRGKAEKHSLGRDPCRGSAVQMLELKNTHIIGVGSPETVSLIGHGREGEVGKGKAPSVSTSSM